tara:strand:- start:56 stop:250 length:195 start_codon:yes stop_codon:yes gene_type:complete
MNFIEVDFLSIVIGYTVGVALMWSVTQTIFHTEVNDDEGTKESDENFRGSTYHWNYPYNLPTPD